MDFLPSDYKAPSSGSDGYLKIKKDTENRIRIMSKPILGWEDWTADKRPVRFRMDSKPQSPLVADNKIRHFWAFVVYNYNESKIQIMHIVQASIQKQIQALVTNSDWGSPYTYDIKIVRKGENMETEYYCSPCPHKVIDSSIIEAYHEKPCNLEALFTGEDPFAQYQHKYTSCECEPGESKKENNPLLIEHAQVVSLQKILEPDDSIAKELMDGLKKMDIHNLKDIPKTIYDKVIKKAVTIRELWEMKEKKDLDLPF